MDYLLVFFSLLYLVVFTFFCLNAYRWIMNLGKENIEKITTKVALNGAILLFAGGTLIALRSVN